MKPEKKGDTLRDLFERPISKKARSLGPFRPRRMTELSLKILRAGSVGKPLRLSTMAYHAYSNTRRFLQDRDEAKTVLQRQTIEEMSFLQFYEGFEVEYHIMIAANYEEGTPYTYLWDTELKGKSMLQAVEWITTFLVEWVAQNALANEDLKPFRTIMVAVLPRLETKFSFMHSTAETVFTMIAPNMDRLFTRKIIFPTTIQMFMEVWKWMVSIFMVTSNASEQERKSRSFRWPE